MLPTAKLPVFIRPLSLALCTMACLCFIYRQRWHKCGTCFALQCSDMFPLLVIDQRAACVNNGTGVTALCAPYTGMHTLCSIRRLQRACSSFKNIPPCFFQLSPPHPGAVQPSSAEPAESQPVWLHLRLEQRPSDGELCLSCYLAVAAGREMGRIFSPPHRYCWPWRSLAGRRHSSLWRVDAAGRRGDDACACVQY